MSAREVVNLVERDSGIKLSQRSIQKKVRDGNIGMSPLQRGPKGFIPDRHYQNLCIAYESFVSINQLNGKLRACRPKRVGPFLHRVIYGDASDGDWSPESYSVKDLDCLLAWHQVKDLPPKAKKEHKIARWKEIVASQKPPPPYERWTDENEQRLVSLQSKDAIGIEDTMFGREVALKKRELEAAGRHFTREERAAMSRKSEAMDEAKDVAVAVEEPMQQSADTAREDKCDTA
jgi:hypothetical protein